MTKAPDRNETRPSPPSRLRRAAWTACLLAALLAALPAALPRLSQWLLVPATARGLGLAELTADVRRLDFTGLDLGEITLGPEAGIRVAAVQADWTPTGLMRGRAERLRIMGLRVAIDGRDGTWSVRGLPGKGTARGDGPAFLPQIGELFVDGVLELDGADPELRCPFTLQGSLDDGGLAVLNATTELAGQTLRLAVRADFAHRDIRLSCALPPASLAALAGLIPGLSDIPLSGTLEALAEAALPADGKTQAQASLNLSAAKAAPGPVRIAQENGTGARLRWNDGLGLEIDPIRLSEPLPLVVTIGGLNADLRTGTLDCDWELTLAALPGLEIPSPLRLAAHTAARRADGGWLVRTTGRLDNLRARPHAVPDLETELEPGALALDISTVSNGTRLDATMGPGRLRIARGETTATLTGLSLSGNATTGPAGTQGVLRLDGGRLAAGLPGLTLGATRLTGSCDFLAGETTSLAGNIEADIAARSGSLAASATLRVPLAWPAPAAPGRLSASLSLGKRTVAEISSRIAQDLHGLDLDGALTVPPLALRAPLAGRIDTRSPRASWLEAKADQTVTLPGDLPRFTPVLATLAGSARLQASARLDLKGGTPVLPAAMKLSDIELTHGKTKAAIHGGSLAIALPDALAARSDPDQRLAFDRLQLGAVLLERGDVRYQVESPRSFLVEGGSFRWAGGRVGTKAFRINPGVEDYTVEMYCDRVELPRALGQLGMTGASGGGTANGRIPVRWSAGKLAFDNGFLYSTPGEKGVLRIEGTEILTAGVPPDTPQFGQLDLAAEALKDFEYQWAKVNMNTAGGELVVALQMDGKPQKPLPFVYDREIGGFARISAGSPGSVFQGIRLDVNFRLPLDQLLQYRQLLELMNNGG